MPAIDTANDRFPSFFMMCLILGLLSMMSLLPTDLYLPALPTIATEFSASVSQVQWTLIIFFIGLALAQLCWGPASDYFGRRPILLGTIAVFFLATVVCAAAPNLNTLIAARFVQAFAGGALTVLPKAITMDKYSGAEATQLIGITTIITACAPMFAPLAGSALLYFSGWRMTFYVIAIISLLAWWLVFKSLPETRSRASVEAFTASQLATIPLMLLRSSDFLRPTMMSASAFGCFSILITASPFVYTGQFELSPSQFSIAFGINALGFVIAAISGGALTKRYSALHVLFIGKVLFIVACILLVSLSLLFPTTLWLAVATLFCVLFAIGLILPTATVLAIEPYSEFSGVTSSLMGAIQLLFGALSALALSFVFSGSLTQMALGLTCCALVAFLVAPSNRATKAVGETGL